MFTSGGNQYKSKACNLTVYICAFLSRWSSFPSLSTCRDSATGRGCIACNEKQHYKSSLCLLFALIQTHQRSLSCFLVRSYGFWRFIFCISALNSFATRNLPAQKAAYDFRHEEYFIQCSQHLSLPVVVSWQKHVSHTRWDGFLAKLPLHRIVQLRKFIDMCH